MMGWQWHQLYHMQIICTSLQTDVPVPHQTAQSYHKFLLATDLTVLLHVTCHKLQVLIPHHILLQFSMEWSGILAMTTK